MKKYVVFLLTRIIYCWGIIWYDKKYLTGKYFNKYHFSPGWKWILRCWFPQKVLGYARHVPFPVPRGINIVNPNNIIFDPDDIDNFLSLGCFWQATKAKIIVGKGTMIAPNCGLITTNHDIHDITKHVEGKDIIIGDKCWIGMNCVILPGVELGPNTIVGAGSIVTKSFKEGNCVIAGNPAKIIKKL